MINVVKIGGNVIDDPKALASFLDDFAALEGKKILVHGGGKEASRLMRSMGIEPVMVDGRRVTDLPTLEIVTMVYAGAINKRITSMLQCRGCDAIGLTGADGNAIRATRRPPQPVDFGYVGDIDPADVNRRLIETLLNQGYSPTFCAICHDGRGSLLNCNADSVASAVAIAASLIDRTRLTYCFERPGVLLDPDDDSSVIRSVTSESFARLRADGTVAQGMLPKLQNALASAAQGVAEVRICSSKALLSDSGTIVTIE